MFKELKEINSRPAPFQFYTADELWTNEHTSKQMLEYHLNDSIDASSRNKNFIERSVALWSGLSPISKWIKTLKLRILAVVLGYIQPDWQNEAQLLPALISQIIP